MATRRVYFGSLLTPDTSGNVWWQPSSILDTNDLYPTRPVLVFADTATKDSAMCEFPMPKNYVGTAKLGVRFKTTATSGNVLWTVDYTSKSTGETGDPSAHQRSLAGTATAVAGTTNFEAEVLLTATDADFAIDDLVSVMVSRNGAGADTVAASMQLLEAFFEYADS